MDDADNLIPLDPAYKSLLRLQLAFAAMILLVAATTENPSFSVISPLLSRSLGSGA